MAEFVHDRLPCGIEYAVLPLPRRHVIAFQIRVLSGAADDPPERLGLAKLIEETLDKGTARHTGRELSDAFDAIGASASSGTGRETTTFSCTVLPEHFERAVALHAEMLRTPSFPREVFEVNLDLSRQELTALEDDAHALTDKLIGRQAYGPVLGRHTLGELETLERIALQDLHDHWRAHFCAGGMLVAVSGAVDPRCAAEVFERNFAGFGESARRGREAWPVTFESRTSHHHKELLQEQIAICWPGVDATHGDFPVQQVLLGVLSGGMSGRLFTEVREKLGLVYWVSAWQETPRGSGMIFLGASTTPDRCDRTFATLLGEVDRLAEDVEQEELDRAVTGIVAGDETRGDTTRLRCAELASDLFFHGRPLPPEEKTAKVQAVTIDDLRRYLSTYPRDRLCVVTLGPKPLTGA